MSPRGHLEYRGGDRRRDNIQVNDRTRATVTITLPIMTICGFFVTVGVGVLVKDRADALEKMDTILALQAANVEWQRAYEHRVAALESFRERMTTSGCDDRRCSRIEQEIEQLLQR